MNLRDQLKEILPDILPRNPNQSIKGTELIESVKYRLKQEYSDATLRYHFSIMSCDPSSPIAKVAQGQGYYLRTETIHSMNSAMNMIGNENASDQLTAFTSGDSDLVIHRANKFRAVVQKYNETRGYTPFSFEESFSENAVINRWQVPDLSVVEWLAGQLTEDGIMLDKEKADVLRRLGKNPVRISSIKLRLELNNLNANEILHQCLSTSEWANGGELVVAAAITDDKLLSQIQKFSSRYGIGVVSFGLDADIIDDLPESAAIENLTAEEFESICSLFDIRRYAVPVKRTSFDWQHVSDHRQENEDFARFERWLSCCLSEERVIAPREFLHQERATVEVETAAVA